MSGLYKRKNVSSGQTLVTTLQVSSSIYGACIPVVYGTTRIASNLVDYDDFASHANTTKTGKGGGTSSTDYTYSASAIFGLCHGPIQGVGTIWQDKTVYTLATSGFTVMFGTRPQAPWATWTSTHSAKALAYAGIALACQQNMALNSDGSMPNWNWEVGAIAASGQIFVPGTTRPWDGYVEGKDMLFADGGSTAPVSIALGTHTSISLVATGAVYGVVMNDYGDPTKAGNGPGSTVDAYYQQLGPSRRTINNSLLQGAFMDDSGNIIQAMGIGDGGTWAVPSGATHLQLGICDGANELTIGTTTTPAGGFADNTGGFNVICNVAGADADPAVIIPDLLSNPYYGAGWTSGLIGDLSLYAACCTACNWRVSPAFTEQTTAADALQLLLDATHADCRLHAGTSGMTLQVLPLLDVPVSSNGNTYTPVTAPIYDLVEDDFLGVVGADGTPTGDDRITITRSSTTDICNSIPVEYWERSDSYNVHTVEEPDVADVTANGYKPDSSLSLHLITNEVHARTISRLRALRDIYVRNTYAFKIGWKFSLLEPLDLVTLTDSLLGLSHRVVRVLSIDMPEETSEEEGMSVIAEDWPFGTASATAYPASSGGYTGSTSAPVSTTAPVDYTTVPPTAGTTTTLNTSADPGPVAAPVIFEPPALLADSSSPEIWIGAAGLGQYWGGANVLLSTDGGTSYTQVAQISSSARFGVLTAALPATADPDTTDTLAVSLVASAGSLTGTSASGLAAWATVALVDSEIVAFETATLTGPNAYNLTTLRRGGYGSSVAAHASEARFLRLDDAVVKETYDSSLVGTVLHFKFQSFNIWGNGLEDIAGLTAYAFTPAGTAASQYPQPSAVTVTESASQPTPAAGVEYRLIDTWQDGISYNGGAPLALQKIWLDITWTWPSSTSNPEDFDVVLFTGSDPTNPETYIREPIRVDGTVRQLVIAVAASASASVNAAVRSHYA